MAEQQDRELIMIMSDASNSDSDEDEPVIVLADVSVTQPVRVLMSVLHDAKEEDIIKSSSLGPAVLKVIENLLKLDLEIFATEVVREVQSCVTGTKKEKCKTVPLSRVWRNFHAMRLSSRIRSLWQSCLSSIQLPQDFPKVSDLVLQIILTRTMHALVSQMKSGIEKVPQPQIADLTVREQNVIRYLLFSLKCCMVKGCMET